MRVRMRRELVATMDLAQGRVFKLLRDSWPS